MIVLPRLLGINLTSIPCAYVSPDGMHSWYTNRYHICHPHEQLKARMLAGRAIATTLYDLDCCAAICGWPERLVPLMLSKHSAGKCAVLDVAGVLMSDDIA